MNQMTKILTNPDEVPVAIEEAALRDPDDTAVLACALAARVDAIISVDNDLHALGNYQGIQSSRLRTTCKDSVSPRSTTPAQSGRRS